MGSSDNSLEELRQLLSIAKEPRVVSLLSSEIHNLEKLSNAAVPAPSQQTPAPVPTVNAPTLISIEPKAVSKTLNYVTLSSFSWDQDEDQLKIYISLEGVDREKVDADFKPMCFDIKFHDIRGKNYHCAVPKLNKEIVPEKCKLIVKPKHVVVTLAKASKKKWLDLHFKGHKPRLNFDKGQDPLLFLMDLMKNLYEKGGDDVQRNMAKAWADAIDA